MERYRENYPLMTPRVVHTISTRNCPRTSNRTLTLLIRTISKLEVILRVGFQTRRL